MAIRSANTQKTYERHRWASNNGLVQVWVNDIIWKLLTDAPGPLELPGLVNVPPEAVAVCCEVLAENQLEGLALLAYRENLQDLLGSPFFERAQHIKRRTEVFGQEVQWLISPKVGEVSIPIEDYAFRPYYLAQSSSDDAFNPRMIHGLTLWAPTLAARDEVSRTLQEGGFVHDRESKDEYSYVKPTEGILHRVCVKSTLWEASKNWALDIEREIWDRAVTRSTRPPYKLDPTDLFVLAARRFAIDSLLGSGILLSDLATLVSQAGDSIDWDRIRHIKNTFVKPDWLWGALVGLEVLHRKTGRSFELPEWANKGVRECDQFIWDFLESRVNWANPDTKLIEFTRAHVKMAKGT